MHRNERTPFFRLLGEIHAQRRVPSLSASWRDAVMRDVSACVRPPVSEMMRLVPRLTVAAAALTLIFAITAGQVLSGLPDEMCSYYANQAYALDPMSFLHF